MAWLGTNGHEGWLLPDDGAELGLPHHIGERPLSAADVVLCLGGDGTMLRAVGALDGAPVPLLGVNLGQLGYLTEIEPADVTDALERFAMGPDDGGWHLDVRLMLQHRGPSPRIAARRVAGAERGRGREARGGAHRSPAGADRRRAVHELPGRRTHRRRRRPDRPPTRCRRAARWCRRAIGHCC